MSYRPRAYYAQHGSRGLSEAIDRALRPDTAPAVTRYPIHQDGGHTWLPGAGIWQGREYCACGQVKPVELC